MDGKRKINLGIGVFLLSNLHHLISFFFFFFSGKLADIVLGFDSVKDYKVRSILLAP